MATTVDQADRSVAFERRGQYAIATLNRPQVHNAFDQDLLDEMTQILLDYDGDDDLRALVITGAGVKAFCTGADLTKGPPPGAPAGIQDAWRQAARSAFDVLADLRKPVITAINGYCIAGGMIFLLNSDIRIASSSASFQFSEPRIAGFPGKRAVALLVRQIGYVQAMNLLLTARRISAEEALAAGLLTEVCGPEELMPRAEAVAQEVAGMAPLSLRASKEAALVANGSAEVNLDNYITMLLRDTEDRAEGRLAFREKRPPGFLGR